MYLSEVHLEVTGRPNPYDWHRTLWRFFDLPQGATRPFQFRVEQVESNRAGVLMQSSLPVKQHVDGAWLGRQRQFKPEFRFGQQLRFRLKANPTKAIRDEKGRLNSKGKIKTCRVPLVKEDEQIQWLERKLAGLAELGEVFVGGHENLYFRKGGHVGKVVTLTYDGILRVENPKRFEEVFRVGIGPAKSMGCGLLSLAAA
jgi:CRISPR system Cascade subunit CasE